jgi:cytochrome d ubiquinol oxidase subunit I
MVGVGFALMVVAAWFAFVDRVRKREWSGLLLRVVALAAPLGFVALEAGWIVTEVGRQPWIIYGVMATRDAVTPARQIATTFAAFSVLYTVLGIALVVLLRRLAEQRVIEHG